MRSEYDSKGKLWTTCCECERGGNGSDEDKCASGGKTKRWNKMGCTTGTLMKKYLNKKCCDCPAHKILCNGGPYEDEENRNELQQGIKFCRNFHKALQERYTKKADTADSVREEPLEYLSRADLQLTIMKNIERIITNIHKNNDLRRWWDMAPNWFRVQTFINGNTKKGGSTSSFEQCEFLGVDVDGYTFFETQD